MKKMYLKKTISIRAATTITIVSTYCLPRPLQQHVVGIWSRSGRKKKQGVQRGRDKGENGNENPQKRRCQQVEYCFFNVVNNKKHITKNNNNNNEAYAEISNKKYALTKKLKNV